MQDWKPSVPEGPLHDPALPDSHAESLQPSPQDMPAVDIPTASDPMSIPGPPQDPPSAPVHSIPLLQGAASVGSLPSAPLGQNFPGSGNQQSSMQHLQAALSAQSQVGLLLLLSQGFTLCCACPFHDKGGVPSSAVLSHALKGVKAVSQGVTALCGEGFCRHWLCCAMLCHAMLCHVALCMLYCAVPCHAMLCCDPLCMLCDVL